MKKILRTYEEMFDYMLKTKEDEGRRFVSVEQRRWYNPMRLLYGDIYYKVLTTLPKK